MSHSVANTSMSGPLSVSLLCHIILVALFMAGTPFMPQDTVYEQPVAVEIAEIDELTQSDKLPTRPQEMIVEPSDPVADLQESDQKKSTPAPLPQPPAPRQKPAALLKPVPPQKPDIPEMAEIPKASSSSPKEVKPDITHDLSKPDLAEVAKEKAQKQIDNDRENVSQDIDRLVNKLAGSESPVLKDLTPPEPAVQDGTASSQEQSPNISRIADRLTISEQDALRRQLSQCWNVIAGAREAENLVVRVKLNVNPDRTVSSAQLIDNGRYSKDPFYRAAADSALRAVRNPRCNPLRLPPDKYEEWKVIIVNFDPRNMF